MRIKIITFFFLTTVIVACQQTDKQSDSQTDTTTVAQEPLTEEEKQQYKEQGQKIALSVFTELSGQLQQALQEGGVPQAIEHCNLVAMPLVDSLSKVYQADIKRTSLKVRNPEDAPTAEERDLLQNYAATKAEGGALEPVVLRQGKDIAFYAPIGIQPLCLKCHGTVGEDIAEADYETIKRLYPEDEAIGYQEGDLRGMWRITFN